MRKPFGIGFGISLAIYLAYYLLFPVTLGYFRLISGLLMLFAGGFVLNIFSNNKILFVLLLGISLVGLWHLPEIPKIPDFFTFFKTSGFNKNNLADKEFELLVELKPGKKVADLQKIIEKYHLTTETAFKLKNNENTDLDDFISVNIPESELGKFDEIVSAIQQSASVDALEINEIVKLDKPISYQPKKSDNDNSFLNDPELHKVWAFESMQMKALYELLKTKKIRPKKRAKIAILDTGIDASHEDLQEHYTSTRLEYDEDPNGHGTHCAGIAASVSNNKKGIASCFPDKDFVEVTSVQVFPKTGNTTQRKIIQGMIIAVESGADVISMSLGGPSSDQAQRAYSEALKYVHQVGAVVVVAAGNEKMDAQNRVPASVKGVITVSAVDEDLKLAVFSNDVSKIEMGIAAPGVNIFSSVPGSKYDFMSGTSMATPYVAGLAGLMKSLNPELNTEQIYRLLHQSGKATKQETKSGRFIQPFGVIKEIVKEF